MYALLLLVLWNLLVKGDEFTRLVSPTPDSTHSLPHPQSQPDLQIHVKVIDLSTDGGVQCLQVRPDPAGEVHVAQNQTFMLHVQADAASSTSLESGARTSCVRWLRVVSDDDTVLWLLLQTPRACSTRGLLHVRDGSVGKRWELCRRWVAPGIDFVTDGNAFAVGFEIHAVPGEVYRARLMVRAVTPSNKRHLELRYLSATLGYFLLVFGVNCGLLLCVRARARARACVCVCVCVCQIKPDMCSFQIYQV